MGKQQVTVLIGKLSWLCCSNVAGAGKCTSEGGHTSRVKCSSIHTTSYGVHTKTGCNIDNTSPSGCLAWSASCWRKRKRTSAPLSSAESSTPMRPATTVTLMLISEEARPQTENGLKYQSFKCGYVRYWWHFNLHVTCIFLLIEFAHQLCVQLALHWQDTENVDPSQNSSCCYAWAAVSCKVKHMVSKIGFPW